MKLLRCRCTIGCALLLGLSLLSGSVHLSGQPIAAPGKIVDARVERGVHASRGTTVKVPILVTLPVGYHVNSNQPRDKFLKPLSLTWTSGGLAAKAATFPKARDKSYAFSDKTLSVYEGTFEIVQEFEVAKDAPQGEGAVSGKLAYQACTESECYPPSSVSLTLQYDIR